MRPVTWDSGIRFDDPNLRWGSPSYLLEPGDPGYAPPENEETTQPKGTHPMSNNPIPRNHKVLLALAEDAADGCAQAQDDVGLKATREDDLRALLTNLKGDMAAAPPVPGLIYSYDMAKMARNDALAALRAKDAEARKFLIDTRDVLKKVLGDAPSAEWVAAGFTEVGSTAVPNTQDERFASLNALALYLSQHPAYEVPGGGPLPEVTSARATALHGEVSDARQGVNDADTAQRAARDARDAGHGALRRKLIVFVDELQALLPDDDARWECFGLNIPANPRAPEPAGNLELSPAGPGRALISWDRGARSDDNRILIQIVGTDTEWREYGKTGNVTETTIKDQPSGATLRVKVIALNGSLEASDGPEGEIVVE
ncbi:MAG: fibronectin type III domain-containing protein [Akkermansiaceae bacterium]|nr:fibronectin type III domain-containing protein [Akkermansiaceae bacterium]